MGGDDLAQEHGGHRAVGHYQLDGATDVGHGHRVAGRTEPDTAQPVDLAGHHLADPSPERRQVAEQLPLCHQPVGGDGSDLGVHLSVDLGAPGHSLGVGMGQVGDGQLLGDHEVGLHVADQVLDDALGLGVGTLAEIRPSPVVGDEAYVVGSGDNQPGHRCALQASHAVGEEGLRHSTDRLHALGQCAHGRLSPKVVGEVDEAEPAPGQHRAEDEQRTDLPPVEHQHVARCPHAGPASPVVVDPPRRLGFGHGPAQIARRPGVAGGPDDGQETLGRDPALRLRHPLGDEVRHRVVVMGDGDLVCTAHLGRSRLLHGSFDGLVGGAADLRCCSVGAHLLVGGMHVHSFPR